MTRSSSAEPIDPGAGGAGGGAELPLAGVRVLELSMNIAGPYAAMILGDLGAQVTKVELPPRGDDSRRMTPTDGDTSAYFVAVNRNKTSIWLDLRNDAERERFWSLLRQTDVFVTNMRPSKLREFGLAYPQVKAFAGGVIYADLSGYGNSGPDADRAGYDLVLQARSGLLSVNGEPDRPPVRVGVSILDMSAGIWLALGVIAALRTRDRNGQGCRVSTSLLETGAGFLAYDIAAYGMTSEVPGRRGSEHPAFGPYGIFECRSGTHLALGAGADHLFERLARALGHAEWIADPRFPDNGGRIRYRAELRRLIETRLATHTAAEWVTILNAAGLPADEVANVPGVLGDQQLQSLDFWLDLPAHELRLPGLPIRFDQHRPPMRLAPPTIDATDELPAA
jgi:crotonobetainyl-CoA:carnitine CoA-transferase CaiB-like acyl-CoA transferase